jgi:hypothetical protein
VAGGWHELGEQETRDQVEDAARGKDGKHEAQPRDSPSLLQHRPVSRAKTGGGVQSTIARSG